MLRTPVTVITGPLGSGKTTLLRHILEKASGRIAVIMNEFGELAIDARVIAGRHVKIAELAGGCVCCSLAGEFEAAIEEIIATVTPEMIVVETTGLAEPDALVVSISEELAQTRLDGVVSLADADALARFPQLGHTERTQIAAADLIVLNKIDLVSPAQLASARARLKTINADAPIVSASRGQVDPELLFGIRGTRKPAPVSHLHQPELQSFSYTTARVLNRVCFERLTAMLHPGIYRAKGFVRFADSSYLYNFVAGRFELEPMHADSTELVFIGREAIELRAAIVAALDACQD